MNRLNAPTAVHRWMGMGMAENIGKAVIIVI